MTDLTSLSQLADKKNITIVFTDQRFCCDRIKDALSETDNILNADVNTEIGKNLKEAHGVDYIPSAIVIKNGKPSVRRGTGAILENAKC